VLQTRDDYTVVREVVPGSPAGLSGKIKVGDRIVGVGRAKAAHDRSAGLAHRRRGGADPRPERFDRALDIMPADAGPDAKHVVLPLVRKKISMEEQSAKKSVIEVRDNGVAPHRRHFSAHLLPGLRSAPPRRQGFQERHARREPLAGRIEKDKVDNVLIDLRNNGGGSLNEAVELTGLFIDKGPVVMQRNAEARSTSKAIPTPAWRGMARWAC
jgi:carboxyl-terminal processing protease